MSAVVEVQEVSKLFAPRLTFGEKIAARLGSAIETRTVHALDRVSLTIAPGEVVGLVGESGCGKSTLGRVIAGILPPSSGSAISICICIPCRSGWRTSRRSYSLKSWPYWVCWRCLRTTTCSG